jgi:hypothetical protein
LVQKVIGGRRCWSGARHRLSIAAYCAPARRDVFPSLVLMSAASPGVPVFSFDTADSEAPAVEPNAVIRKLVAALAALDLPRAVLPAVPEHAAGERGPVASAARPACVPARLLPRQGGDWPGNTPHPLKVKTAAEFAQIPTHYVMER